jgi:hypothetical protein
MLASGERPRIGRTHPLTIEGEEIGSFELSLSCDEPTRDYVLTYVEQRRASESGQAPVAPVAIEVTVSGKSLPLKVLSTRASGPRQLESVAHGRLPPDLLKTFAEANGRSMTIETVNDDLATAIRVGNAGFARALPQLAAACSARQRIRNTARNEIRQGG